MFLEDMKNTIINTNHDFQNIKYLVEDKVHLIFRFNTTHFRKLKFL